MNLKSTILYGSCFLIALAQQIIKPSLILNSFRDRNQLLDQSVNHLRRDQTNPISDIQSQAKKSQPEAARVSENSNNDNKHENIWENKIVNKGNGVQLFIGANQIFINDRQVQDARVGQQTVRDYLSSGHPGNTLRDSNSLKKANQEMLGTAININIYNTNTNTDPQYPSQYSYFAKTDDKDDRLVPKNLQI